MRVDDVAGDICLSLPPLGDELFEHCHLELRLHHHVPLCRLRLVELGRCCSQRQRMPYSSRNESPK